MFDQMGIKVGQMGIKPSPTDTFVARHVGGGKSFRRVCQIKRHRCCYGQKTSASQSLIAKFMSIIATFAFIAALIFTFVVAQTDVRIKDGIYLSEHSSDFDSTKNVYYDWDWANHFACQQQYQPPYSWSTPIIDYYCYPDHYCNPIQFGTDGSRRYAIYDELRYTHVDTNQKGIDKWRCTHNCYCFIYTGVDGAFVKSNGNHKPIVHKRWTTKQQNRTQFMNKIKKKVQDEKEEPHKAYRDIARDYPEDAKLVSGFDAVRSNIYYVREKHGYLLPRNRFGIKDALIKHGMDGNYYGLKLSLSKYDKENTDESTVAVWKSHVSRFYLGDGCDGSGSQYQIWCEKKAAKILSLSLSEYILFDVSFKHTPKLSPAGNDMVPYKGALHIIGVTSNKNPKQTNLAIPCVTILFRHAKPGADTYHEALSELIRQCEIHHQTKIVREDRPFASSVVDMPCVD
eukprot:271187_1